MSTPLKPLGDRIIAVKDQPQTKTASGLYLPDNAKQKSVAATVVAIGKDVKDVKVGDKIIYKDYSPAELKVDNTDYLVVKEEDVLAILV